MEDRIANLEIRIAFQDDLLDALNRTVAAQQQELDLLRHQLRLLHEQLRSLSPSDIVAAKDEPPPPHY